MHTPPLPREIEADPASDAIRARLGAAGRRLWPGGKIVVPLLPLEPALADALRTAYHERRLVLGLESAAAALAIEARGHAALARRPGLASGARVSRLLLLTDDGAERLYRRAERLATLHAPRLLVAIVTAGASVFGHAVTGSPAAVKAVLARHKQVVTALLRTLH